MRIVDPVENGILLPPLLSKTEFAAGSGGRIAESDPRLNTLLAGASAAIRRACGWHIAPMIEETYVLDYDGSGVLSVPTLRLISVEALTMGGQPVDVDGLEWSEIGTVRLPERRRERWRGVEVTMIHGYPLTDVADLGQVVQQVVGNAISSPLGATRERAGQVSVDWATTAPGVAGGISLLARDMAIVNQYKIARTP